MRRLLPLLCLLLATTAAAITPEDRDLLNREIALRHTYDHAKQQRIDSLLRAPLDNYTRYLALVEEYQSYSYDTATIYVEKLLDEATLLNDSDRMTQALIKQAFLYLSSGLFKESADVFEDMDITRVNTRLQAEYYTHYARLCYDMADYSHGQLASNYLLQGYAMSEEALRRIPPQDTVRYWSTAALYAMKQGNPTQAVERFRRALSGSRITDHERAIAYSSMGGLYQDLGDSIQSAHYWVLSAIADLRSATKETVAMGIVAQLCFQQGDIDHAATYIQAALDDATFYNARHRQLSLSKIMPIIEQQQLHIAQHQQRRITLLNTCLYILLAGLCLALILLYNRIRALARATQAIRDANSLLTEANRIKEECIATFLCNESTIYSKIEQYQRYVKRKTNDRRFDELTTIPQYIDVRSLRNDFYKRFDTMFLHIFPGFVDHFNLLLRPEERYHLRPGELLNAELRIFALMRLGITDNTSIANLLDYSINTIYTYKTRVRNCSDLSADEFLQRLMQT